MLLLSQAGIKTRPRQPDRGGRWSITVFISVDSELATSTKTSASKQNLSIQLSSCDVTSVPGLQVEESLAESKAASKSLCCSFLMGFASASHAVLHVVTSYLQMCPKWAEVILLPVYEHQIISKKGTLGLWPKHTDETAGVQTFIHVERMSQLVYSLQSTQSQGGFRQVKDISLIMWLVDPAWPESRFAPCTPAQNMPEN